MKPEFIGNVSDFESVITILKTENEKKPQNTILKGKW